MIKGLRDIFSPFSSISPHSHLFPFSDKLNLGEDLKTDLHSHLIPCVDDGAQSMEESIEMLKSFVKLGYSKVIITPHIMQDRYYNTHAKIDEGLEKIRKELVKESINIELEAAAEYYLDEEFEKLLYNKELLTFGDNYVLFETSFNNNPKKLFDLILEMQLAEYKPVLAHPERYKYMHNNRDIYKKLKDYDVLFQIDLLSFTAYHSFDVQKTALWLCNNGMIDLVGSDAHKIEDLQSIEKLKSTSILKKVYEKNNLLNNML